MYSDTKPCQVCGSPVDLAPRTDGDDLRVADPDAVTDDRTCSNPDCPTNSPHSQRSP